MYTAFIVRRSGRGRKQVNRVATVYVQAPILQKVGRCFVNGKSARLPEARTETPWMHSTKTLALLLFEHHT